jgi:type II secretory pathway component PulF
MEQDLQNLQKKIEEQDIKLDAIYKSVEKTRKYFLMIIWVTVIAVVLPLIGMVFVLPSFISSYTSTLNGLGY